MNDVNGLIALWEVRHKYIMECADGNEKRGDILAARQLQAQAFGVKLCLDELIDWHRIHLSSTAKTKPLP